MHVVAFLCGMLFVGVVWYTLNWYQEARWQMVGSLSRFVISLVLEMNAFLVVLLGAVVFHVNLLFVVAGMCALPLLMVLAYLYVRYLL